MPKTSKPDTKILILTSTFPRWDNDSVTNFVFDFAKGLKTGREPIVLAPHYPGAKKEDQMEGVQVYRFQYWFLQNGQNVVYGGGGVPNFKKTPLHILKLVGYASAMLARTIRIARREKVEIINPHWLIPQGFLAIIANAFIGSKVVVTIHGGDVFSFNGRLFRTIKRWTLKRADEVVVNSSATLDAAKKLYSEREYHVIPMGIDTEHFSPAKGEKTQNNTTNILFTGRISEEKGMIYLCQAINQLIEEGHTNLHLKIAGTGPEKEAIEEYVQSHRLERYIEFIGWVDPSELPFYYREADVFVGPSIISDTGWQEAFGLVFAESLATGTPAVATQTGGIKDIIIEGENGFLVPEKDARAIADKIKLINADNALLSKLKANARSHIINNFSWEAIIEKYNYTFDTLEKKRRK